MPPQQHILRNHPRLEAILPLVARFLGGSIAVLAVVVLVLYGISVYLECQVLKLGKETRALQEDNQNLGITLDRLRSFEKVGAVSAKIQGMQAANEIIDIAATHRAAFEPPKPPVSRLPKEVYGY